MRIFLIGFMGSGKTTIGKKLAQQLQYSFVDLDKQIEKKSGVSIPEYFELHGENAFRLLERECLQTDVPVSDVVIATGGGAPCYFDNMEWMNRNGLTIYLTLSPRALASRLRGCTNRPLLRGRSGEELVKFIEEKLAEREPFYKKARYWVAGLDLTADRLAAYIRSMQA